LKEHVIFQSSIFKGYVNFQGVSPGVIRFDTDRGGWLPFCLIGGTFASCFKLLSSLPTLMGKKQRSSQWRWWNKVPMNETEVFFL